MYTSLNFSSCPSSFKTSWNYALDHIAMLGYIVSNQYLEYLFLFKMCPFSSSIILKSHVSCFHLFLVLSHIVSSEPRWFNNYKKKRYRGIFQDFFVNHLWTVASYKHIMGMLHRGVTMVIQGRMGSYTLLPWASCWML